MVFLSPAFQFCENIRSDPLASTLGLDEHPFDLGLGVGKSLEGSATNWFDFEVSNNSTNDSGEIVQLREEVVLLADAYVRFHIKYSQQ